MTSRSRSTTSSPIPVIADRSLEQDDEIVFNAGSHTLTATLAFGDFVRLVEPRMAEFARRN